MRPTLVSLLAIAALALPSTPMAQPVSNASKSKPHDSRPVAVKAGAQDASTGSSKEAEAPQWGPLGFHATWVRPDWRPPVRDPVPRKAPRR